VASGLLPGQHSGMELSVSLSERDVELLDKYVHARGLRSRSAAVQHAIHLLGEVGLEQDYAAAWDDWKPSGAHVTWESVAGDGVSDAPR
jgi:Arc/MetJ-type ribon-helix-helix transcriptional regulator